MAKCNEQKRVGIIMILLVFVSLPMLYYYISHSLVISGASESIAAGTLIGYYSATKRKNRHYWILLRKSKKK
jgi:NhaP-type Na+/H+ or K+/H+ antiporter